MTQRRNKFPPPTLPRGGRSGTVRNEVAAPVGGFHPEVPPHNLSAEASPFMENFAIDDGFVAPRSGLSRLPTSAESWGDVFSGAPIRALGVARGLSLGAPVELNVVFSDRTVATITNTVMANLTGPLFAASDVSFDDVSFRGMSSAVSPHIEYVVFTRQGNALTSEPMYITQPGTASSYASFLPILSQESRVAAFETFDDRLLACNCVANDGPTSRTMRVRWSVRGNPLDFTSVGAGFEDLKAMRGEEIVGTAKGGDFIYVFTNQEVWYGVSRRDDYAFDFDVTDQGPGTPFAKAIAETPRGVFYVTADYRIRRLVGRESAEISPRIGDYLRTNIANSKSLALEYNEADNSLLVVYAETDNADDSADHALELYLDSVAQVGDGAIDGVWARHSFAVPITAVGRVILRPAVADISAGAQNSRVVGFGSSGGTVYYLAPGVTTDAGSVITCRYQFPPLHGSREHLGFEAPTEVFVDYRADSAASLEIRHSTDMGGNWTTLGSYALSNTSSYDSTAFMPVTAQAAQHAMLEFRGTAEALPDKIGRVSVSLRNYSGTRRGGR